MVVLTIVAQKNGETVFFDEPIPQVHFMRLLSCSIYNSWDTLKNEGTLSALQPNKSYKVSKILPGHYTLETFKSAIEESLKKYAHEISADIYSPHGQLVITNHDFDKPLRIDRDLANLLGVGRELKNPIAFVKRISSPTAYYIHCDLIDKNQNFFNNKKTDLLAKFDVKGRPYEKVSYHSFPEQSLRDYSTSSFVNSITLSVRDENGELFDFKGLPIEFELEII